MLALPPKPVVFVYSNTSSGSNLRELLVHRALNHFSLPEFFQSEGLAAAKSSNATFNVEVTQAIHEHGTFKKCCMQDC